ncbi:Lar family restriction alleviation protein [Caballeronia zhejiangensis]|uniref:Lar family restriction alleviation protein n=1 Tax=Caballeronia zhejiangensis TaxID=871203 RepID=UPI001FD5FE65|nr:Lar family restriction alleviation protein [Caballeronia zhejiangensis]
MQELKPCPFCGGKPFLKYGDGIVGISCPPDSACNKAGLCVAFSPEKEATAVTAWNSRALESRVLAERKPSAKDQARRFVSDFTREMGFAMSDHAQEVMLNLFLRHVAHPTPDDAISESELSKLLPGPYYMDQPDGGSVTLLEQLQRMAKDAARYRWLKGQKDEFDKMAGASCYGTKLSNRLWQEEDWDAAIDRAMQDKESGRD